MNREQKGIVYILIFQTLVGLSPLLIKIVNPNFSAALLVFLRYSISSLFVLVFILMSKPLLQEIRALTLKKINGLIFLGILGSGLGSLLFVFAVRMIGVSLSSIIENLEIPIGILLAVIFLKEKLTKRFVVIGAAILTGFYMLTINNNTFSQPGSNFLFGILIAFSTAIIFGSATVTAKVLLSSNISPTIVSFFRQGLGALFNLAIALITLHSLSSIFTLNAKDWFAIIILGIFMGGVGFILYYKALHIVEVKKISFFFIASPIVSTITGVATGERLSIIQWIGTVTILIGIAMILRVKDSKIPLPDKEEE